MESVLSSTGSFRPVGVVPSMAPVLRQSVKIVCSSVRRGDERRRRRPRDRPPSDLSKNWKEPDRKEINGLWTKITKGPDDGKEPEWRVVIVKDGEIVEDPWLTARRKWKEELFDQWLDKRMAERRTASVPEEEIKNERLWYTRMMAERQERQKEPRTERRTSEPWSAVRRKMTMAAAAEEGEEEEEEECGFPSDLDLAGRGHEAGPPSFPGRGSLLAKLPKPPPLP